MTSKSLDGELGRHHKSAGRFLQSCSQSELSRPEGRTFRRRWCPAVPRCSTAARPAEIVVFKGQPQWAAVTGTQLLYASNTASPVFKYLPTKTYYYLTSGRWFSSQSAMGPWTFATNSLPADFQKIPPSSPMGGVLASVPGTPQAEDAVLMAQVPTTAVINPDDSRQSR